MSNNTIKHSVAQQEAAYWARQAKQIDTELPNVFKHLEELMLATRTHYVSVRIAQDVLHMKYPMTFIRRENVAHYLTSSKNFEAFLKHCDTGKFGQAMQHLVVLGNWRLTQQVFSYDPSIAAELAWEPEDKPGAADDAGKPLPVGHLARLPYLSFVIVPNLPVDHPTYGSLQSMMVNVMHPDDVSQFAELTASCADSEADDPTNRVVSFAVMIHFREKNDTGVFEDRLLTQVVEAAQPGMTLEEIERNVRARMHNTLGHAAEVDVFRRLTAAEFDVLELSMPFLLYLCADNRDLEGVPNTVPVPAKTKKGVRIFAADRPTVLPVGARIGAALRMHQANQTAPNDSHVPTGAMRIGHMRRAHWHTYWKGSLKQPEKRTMLLRFLPPIPVNLTSPDQLMPVVRPVKPT